MKLERNGTPQLPKTWSIEEITAWYQKPLLELVFQAATVHRNYHNPQEIQLCTLCSIKTGGCSEDCAYCPQSARYQTGLARHQLLDVSTVLEEAKQAKKAGSSRFCMGAAWREVKDNEDFDHIIDMVKGVRALGLEACCTLGMLTLSQAKRLKEAGLTAYNHNLDTSERYYGDIIHTRTYQDRLDTLQNVSMAGISICCGGIIGMGETQEDRMSLLHTLSQLEVPPESIPINMLVPIPGTPLEKQDTLDSFEWIRMIAVTRIAFPQSMVRLSAGRLQLSKETQALAFLAGANSIFTGDTLLTTDNPAFQEDQHLLTSLGLHAQHT